MAYLNLFRNKRRSLSTALAICIGFVGLNLLGAYIYRVKRALDATSVYAALHGHVQIFKTDSLQKFSLYPRQYMIDENDIQTLKYSLHPYQNEIEYIGYNLRGSGLLSNGTHSHPVMFVSFESDVYSRSLMQPALKEWAPDWVLPEQFENIKLFQNPEVMSVTPKIADIMGFKKPWSENESVQMAARTVDGDLNAINLDLGAQHTTGMQFLEDTLVMIPYTKAQELLGTRGAESVSVYLKDYDDLEDFYKDLNTKIAPLGFIGYKYYDEKINATYLGILGFLIVMGAFVVLLIGTAVALTIVNSLTMGILERSREIGTLLAVGYNRKNVADLFVIENLILCGFSVLLGSLVTFIITLIVNAANIRFAPPGVAGEIQFRLVWNMAIAGAVTCLIYLIVYVSSVVVMKSRSKVKLIDLLQDAGA